VANGWKWNLDLVNGYIVRRVYHLLSHVEPTTRSDINDIIWRRKK